MLITNDVALITFIPFGILVLKMAKMDVSVCFTVTLMTIAANLGSMLTPIGKPQNLYLFSASGMTLGKFMKIMLPYTAAAAGMLIVLVSIAYKKKRIGTYESDECRKVHIGKGVFYFLLFLLCLLCVINVLNPWILFAAVTLKGNEEIASIAASQLISNVPAALLLSGFTRQWNALIIGTNLGGLGTLIASMESLISYKQIAMQYPEKKTRYLIVFTIWNLVFLAVLYLFGRLGL